MKKIFFLLFFFYVFLIFSDIANANCDSDCQDFLGDVSVIWDNNTTTTINQISLPVDTTIFLNTTVPQNESVHQPKTSVPASIPTNVVSTTTTTLVIKETIDTRQSSMVYPGYNEYCRATKVCAKHLFPSTSSDSFSLFSYRPAIILLWAIFSFFLFMLLNNTIKYSFMYKYCYRTWFQRIFNHN